MGVIIELQDDFLKKLTNYLNDFKVDSSFGTNIFEKISMILENVESFDDSKISTFIKSLQEAIGEHRYSQFLKDNVCIYKLPLTPTDH